MGFFLKLYVKMASFKNRVKNLPSVDERIEVYDRIRFTAPNREVESFLLHLSSILNNEMDDEEMRIMVRTIKQMEAGETQFFNVHVFFSDELMGLTIIVKKDSHHSDILLYSEQKLIESVRTNGALISCNPTVIQ